MKKMFSQITALVVLHLLAFTVSATTVSAYNDTSGYKWGSNSVSYYANNAFASSFITAIKAADAEWDKAGSKFSFTYAGTGSRNPNVWAATYLYTALYKDTYNDIGYYNYGATLEVAATRCTGSGTTLTECDITLNTSLGLTTVGASGSYDLQSVITHEFGHWLHLDHVTSGRSPSYCGTTSLATMCKNYYSVGDLYFRSLSTDDKDGIKAIYGI